MVVQTNTARVSSPRTQRAAAWPRAPTQRGTRRPASPSLRKPRTRHITSGTSSSAVHGIITTPSVAWSKRRATMDSSSSSRDALAPTMLLARSSSTTPPLPHTPRAWSAHVHHHHRHCRGGCQVPPLLHPVFRYTHCASLMF